MNRLPVILCAALAGGSLWAGGFGLGVQTGYPLGDSGVLVPRLDYLHLTDSNSVSGPVTPINLSSTADLLSLGADYDWFIRGHRERGFYVLGGLGVALASIQVDGSTADASASTTSHQTLLYPEVGMGYQFVRNFGLEVVYKDFNFRSVNLAVAGVPVSYSFTSGLELGLVFRF